MWMLEMGGFIYKVCSVALNPWPWVCEEYLESLAVRLVTTIEGASGSPAIRKKDQLHTRLRAIRSLFPVYI